MKPQVFFAVYDSDADSDYCAFDLESDAVEQVREWLAEGLDRDLMTDYGASWGRLYVCSVDADSVPIDGDTSVWSDVWSLWDYEDSVIRCRDIHLSWGDHGMLNINA